MNNVSEQANVQLVQNTYAAFGRGDLPAILQGMAAKIEWYSRYSAGVALDGLWQGHDGVTRLMTAIGTSIDVLAFQPDEFIASGDKVVVLGHEEVQVKATGRRYHNEWVHVFTVREGQIQSLKTYNDSAAVAAAFG